MPDIYNPALKSSPSIYKQAWLITCITALTLVCSLPYRFRSALALEGRKEPVIGLQRHPLIYPIFSRISGISTPFARGNLYLVIPCLNMLSVGTQSLILHYSIVKRAIILYSRKLYTGIASPSIGKKCPSVLHTTLRSNDKEIGTQTN